MAWNRNEQAARAAFAEMQRLAAALEAAREDACVSLVADIRFACGDNGKRMQPELVEFIRGLAEDAERYRYLRNVWGRQIEIVGTGDCTFGVSTPSWRGPWPDLDAAIDQARGKGGGEVGS